MADKYASLLKRVQELAQESVDEGCGDVASIALLWPGKTVRVTPNEVVGWTRYPKRGDYQEGTDGEDSKSL